MISCCMPAHQRAEGGAHHRARLVRQRLGRSVHVAVGVRGGVAARPAGSRPRPAGTTTGGSSADRRRCRAAHFFEGDDRAARRALASARSYGAISNSRSRDAIVQRMWSARAPATSAATDSRTSSSRGAPP